MYASENYSKIIKEYRTIWYKNYKSPKYSKIKVNLSPKYLINNQIAGENKILKIRLIKKVKLFDQLPN